MAMHWREVKDKIEDEIDAIWFEESVEVRMSRLGIFPSGAGTDGQILGNLFFQACDTQAMGWWTAGPTIQQAIEDDTFTLEHCKRLWKYMNEHMAKLMGDAFPPNCPAPWLNLPKCSEFCSDILAAFNTVETKDEFWNLIWSWQNYVNCMNRWFFLVFPWEYGRQLKRKELSDVEEMAALSGLNVKRS